MNELYVFLGAVYGGMMTGLVYCLFRALNALVRRRFVHAALDALFYITASAVIMLTFLRINGGVLRAHLFLGVLLGAFASARALLGVVGLLYTKKGLRAR